MLGKSEGCHSSNDGLHENPPKQRRFKSLLKLPHNITTHCHQVIHQSNTYCSPFSKKASFSSERANFTKAILSSSQQGRNQVQILPEEIPGAPMSLIRHRKRQDDDAEINRKQNPSYGT